MGNEHIDAAKMGTTLIMFVAIVALALVAFIVGKNLMNTGVNQMKGTVQKVNDSRFSDFTGKPVRGDSVKAAFDSFANDNVAILVHTMDMEDKGDTNLAKVDKTAIINGIVDASGKVDSKTDPTGVDANAATYVNYGALLEKDGDNSVSYNATTGKFTASKGFVVDSATGNVKFYNDTTRLSKQGEIEYIADSAQFNSQLIYNTENEIVGVIFTQKKTY